MLLYFNMIYTGIGFALTSFVLLLAYMVLRKNMFTLSVNIVTQIFPIFFIFLSIYGKIHNEGNSLIFYIAPRFGILVTILLPFLVLGTKNKRKLLFSVILPVIWFISFDYFHSIFNLNENIPFNKNDYPLVVFGSGVLLILFVSISYFFQNINEQYQDTIIKQQEDLDKSLIKISDSIRYAQRIQNSLLQGEKLLSDFVDDYFIIFQPKETVSGDFYWIKERNSKLYCMAADCTGHGVPGAFVSMLGFAFLNEIFLSTDISAAEILERLRNKLKEVFSEKGNERQDGMDASLVIIDKEKKLLNFAGAHNPLIQLRDNNITKYKAVANSIGNNSKEKPFEDIYLEIEKNDKFFLFSDGYADQAGGKRKSKITSKKLFELFVEYNLTDMKIVEKKLKEYLDLWMQDSKQIDDILIIGIKI